MITISALGCPPRLPSQPVGLPRRQLLPQMPCRSHWLWSRRVQRPRKPQPKPASIPKHPGVSPPLLTVGSLEDPVKGPAPDNQTLPATPTAVRMSERAGNVHPQHRPLAASLPGPAPWTGVSHAHELTGTAKICSKWPGQPVIAVPLVPQMCLDCTHLKPQPVSSPRDPGQHRAVARTLGTELPFARAV